MNDSEIAAILVLRRLSTTSCTTAGSGTCPEGRDDPAPDVSVDNSYLTDSLAGKEVVMVAASGDVVAVAKIPDEMIEGVENLLKGPTTPEQDAKAAHKYRLRQAESFFRFLEVEVLDGFWLRALVDDANGRWFRNPQVPASAWARTPHPNYRWGGGAMFHNGPPARSEAINFARALFGGSEVPPPRGRQSYE